MKLCIKKLSNAFMVYGPAWAALPQYLSNMLESVQKQTMRVIFPGFLYEDALDLAGLDPLYVRRIDSCKSFVIKAKEVLRVFYSPTVVEHDHNLRSGNKTVCYTSQLKYVF